MISNSNFDVPIVRFIDNKLHVTLFNYFRINIRCEINTLNSDLRTWSNYDNYLGRD